MGQTNESILSNNEELLKLFAVKGKLSEHNLTYLEHLTEGKPYLLREATYNMEGEQQEALARLQARQHFRSPFLTNLVRKRCPTQGSRQARRKGYAPSTSKYSRFGSSRGRPSPTRATSVHSPSGPTPHRKYAPSSNKYRRACSASKDIESTTNA